MASRGSCTQNRLEGMLTTGASLATLKMPAAAAPKGTMTWGVHITLASRWLDPAETEDIITPFMVLYALHDALVKRGAHSCHHEAVDTLVKKCIMSRVCYADPIDGIVKGYDHEEEGAH